MSVSERVWAQGGGAGVGGLSVGYPWGYVLHGGAGALLPHLPTRGRPPGWGAGCIPKRCALAAAPTCGWAPKNAS